MTGADALSIGGLAVALTILTLTGRSWWRAGKKPMDLVPFTAAASVGALWTACVGGLLGAAGGWIAGGVNVAGGEAITRGTGTADGTVATGALAALTPGGAVVVLIATAAGAVAIRAAAKTGKRRIAGGLIVGASLALTAGVASLVNRLIIPLANMPGDQIVAWFGAA
ncbi:hypothetical protein [Streptomyces sp. NPDC049879]|uniref:hypothetical protein n=1 Tax=Streptomyces sp. NPDC049879 TaxID=3365598 RepID=UPI003797BF8F